MKSVAPCFVHQSKLPGPFTRTWRHVSLEAFEHGSLLVEIYAPRGSDPQQPHTRDENYIVAEGSGEYVCGGNRLTFGPTDLYLPQPVRASF